MCIHIDITEVGKGCSREVSLERRDRRYALISINLRLRLRHYKFNLVDLVNGCSLVKTTLRGGRAIP